jgi:RNA ligase
MTLHYEFPFISKIDDVLPHIDDSFRVVEKDGLTYINYNMMGSDVFPAIVAEGGRLTDRINLRAATRRECRGIVFDTKTGEIVSRPYHKFFNVGEREDMALEHIDVSRPHVVLEKLDGSMIRPLPTAGGIRWGTKMGITDVAMLAEEFVADKPKYYDLVKTLDWFTPLFEFGSRRSRIVVDFPEDVMVLLDIRHNTTGGYLARDVVRSVAERFAIPVVDNVDFRGRAAPRAPMYISHLGSFLASAKERSVGEGYVIVWEDGARAKIKADDYVMLHRAKERIASERRVAEAVFDQGLDDVLPLLAEGDRDRVLNWIDDFHTGIRYAADALEEYALYAREKYATKRDFAIATALGMHFPWMRAGIFALWDGKAKNAHDYVTSVIRKSMSSNAKFADAKKTLGITAKWDAVNMEEEA